MRYAIIAAGEGSRLAAEGMSVPKPLVRVGGECLIDRLIRIFMANDADEIVCICNDQAPQVAAHLERLQRYGLAGHPVPLRYMAAHTPSSMHSFHAISPYLDGGPFILTTVDTIFRETEFAAYVADFLRSQDDALMGVTSYIDDERPLHVQVDDHWRVTAFLDHSPVPRYVSAGIYALRQPALLTLHRCMADGQQRMRNYQRALLAGGLRIGAWPFSQVFDVDHVADIGKAEDFLAHQG